MLSSKEPKTKTNWRQAPVELIRIFDNALQSLPEAERRKMFGYPCSFINGQMFAGLHQENLVLRLPEDGRKEFLKIAGAKPFEPMPGRVMKEYVVVPQSVLNSKAQLRTWLEKAFAFAKSLPPKPSKRKA